MATQTSPEGTDEDEYPFPVPNVVVYSWLALLEAVTAAGLVIFGLAILEGGGLIPDILEELSVGYGTFAVVALLSFYIKWR